MYTTKCIIQFIGLIRRITINKAKQINFSSTVIFQIIWSRLIFDSASFINSARELPWTNPIVSSQAVNFPRVTLPSSFPRKKNYCWLFLWILAKEAGFSRFQTSSRSLISRIISIIWAGNTKIQNDLTNNCFRHQ